MTIPVRQLEAFYGGNFCIVRSNRYQQHPAEWHHLDDNNKNDDFSNIVPINGQLNIWLRDINNQIKTNTELVQIPSSELRSDVLQATAVIHFADWNLARAYGCARLASFVARRYLNWPIEIRLEYALQALFYARHCRNFHLLFDVYKRDVIPDLHKLDSISSVIAAALFNELGDTFSDNGAASLACRMYEITLGFGKAAQQSHFRPFRFASRLRKSAAAHGIIEQSLNVTKKQLEQSLAEAPADENQEVIVANALAIVLLHHGYDTDARDALEPLVIRYKRKLVDGSGNVKPKSPSTQAIVDLFQLYAVSVARTEIRKQPKVLEAVQMAKHIQERTGVWPTIPSKDFWPRLAEILATHGVNPKQVSFTPLPQALYDLLNLVFELAISLL